MLEIIDRSEKARKFAYCVVILAFVFGMAWALPSIITAIRWWQVRKKPYDGLILIYLLLLASF